MVDSDISQAGVPQLCTVRIRRGDPLIEQFLTRYPAGSRTRAVEMLMKLFILDYANGELVEDIVFDRMVARGKATDNADGNTQTKKETSAKKKSVKKKNKKEESQPSDNRYESSGISLDSMNDFDDNDTDDDDNSAQNNIVSNIFDD